MLNELNCSEIKKLLEEHSNIGLYNAVVDCRGKTEEWICKNAILAIDESKQYGCFTITIFDDYSNYKKGIGILHKISTRDDDVHIVTTNDGLRICDASKDTRITICIMDPAPNKEAL